MGKVNRWLICQIIHLETALSGVSIRAPVGNATHPKWLQERAVYEGVTYRVTSEDTEALRQWQLMKLLHSRDGKGKEKNECDQDLAEGWNHSSRQLWPETPC